VSTALIIPTLDEIDGMKKVIPFIKKEWVDEIIIVDGGSTDGTIEEAKKLGLRVVEQKYKGRHGAAILTGFEATNADHLIMFGADGNNEPEEIPKLIEKIKDGYDQVIISRFGKTSINKDAGLVDTFGNKMFTFLVNVFFGGHFTDVESSSRMITKKAWADIKLDAVKMDSVQQMCIRGMKKKQKFLEIIGNEGERVGGKRKMKRIPTAICLSKQILKEFIFW